jgi:hypothetical protein
LPFGKLRKTDSLSGRRSVRGNRLEKAGLCHLPPKIKLRQGLGDVQTGQMGKVQLAPRWTKYAHRQQVVIAQLCGSAIAALREARYGDLLCIRQGGKDLAGEAKDNAMDVR